MSCRRATSVAKLEKFARNHGQGDSLITPPIDSRGRPPIIVGNGSTARSLPSHTADTWSITPSPDRWEVDVAGEFGRSLTPEEIMDRLEKRVGPEGRKLFEQFLRKVNKLQMQQHLEARAQGDTERSRERGPG